MPSVWGYARVSREDQNLALQLDALEAAGVIQANIVEEKESGARQRPGFSALLKRLQPGDSLVAWKVDRLGRDALAAYTGPMPANPAPIPTCSPSSRVRSTGS